MTLAKLIACLCLGTALLTGCAVGTSSGSVNVKSTKNCDPTGDADARQACNR
ncbi:MAG TPA: hypothetical protein VLD35_00835 [Caldimonas sp.]|nr:hypothetical protein [Caldimonas sp.]